MQATAYSSRCPSGIIRTNGPDIVICPLDSDWGPLRHQIISGRFKGFYSELGNVLGGFTPRTIDLAAASCRGVVDLMSRVKIYGVTPRHE